MKKSLVIVALTLSMSAQVSAGEAISDAQYSQESCEIVSAVAYEVMDVRQMGVPIHEAFAMSEASFIQDITRDAYDTRIFESEYAKSVIKTEFAKLQYYKCMAEFGVKF
jgi:hypothetical protein